MAFHIEVFQIIRGKGCASLCSCIVTSSVDNKVNNTDTNNEKELYFDCQTWCKPVVNECCADLQGEVARGQISPCLGGTLCKETSQEVKN